LPQVSAILRLLTVSADGTESVIWEKATTLTASVGEAGYHYEPPRLKAAILSPSRATLFAEVIGGGDHERLVLIITAQKTVLAHFP
jgi:hypothetical protein